MHPKISTETRIRDCLVKHGELLFQDSPTFYKFTKNDEADRLLNDLERHPHAFVLASIMDRQIKAERAWLIPFRIKEKLGDFSMSTLRRQSEDDVKTLMTQPESLHRYANKMANLFFKAVQLIDYQYNADASRIWEERPSIAMVVYRFLQFEGIGPKIASMDANILARVFKVEFSDYYSIDISADVHVRRVFGRLGLTNSDATVDQLIFRARGLYPAFPGLMDFPHMRLVKGGAGRESCFAKIVT